MDYTLPGRSLTLQKIPPFVLENMIAWYKKLTSLQQKTDFVSVDFFESMRWQQDTRWQEPFEKDPLITTLKKHFDLFCQTPQKKVSTIPKTLHFIWLGSPLPLFAKLSLDSWLHHHREWEVRVWDDAAVANFCFSDSRCHRNFFATKVFAEKADILRYEILYQYGGLYSDTDVICLKPFDPLVQSLDFFIGIETGRLPLHVGSCIIGASPQHPIMKYCLDHHRGEHEAEDCSLLERCGPGLVSRACCHILATETAFQPLFLPTTYFYPFPFQKRREPLHKAKDYITEESMALHLWNGSWLPY
ncbi:MAG: hypothetical protein FJZ63_00770 [Chlamydiae bacterium]|nr:hypothetical protein [Chlamydiota bacterium]